MRFTPQLTNNLKDAAARQLFEFIFKLLGNVIQYDIYKSRVVYHVPFKLAVPTTGNNPRIKTPDIVRLGRALAVGDEVTPVYTGSVLWRWLGGSQVSIDDVEGLVDGVTYDLTFEVLSSGG